MENPTIQELQDPESFELIAELSHDNIKSFVLNQLAQGGKIIVTFMTYQTLMIILAIFLLIKSIVLTLQHTPENLYFSIAALLFCFTVLIPIHELLHGLAIKLSGAPHVHYGAYFRKFIFFAEADRHVINRVQFTWIALTPLLVVKGIALILTLLFWGTPWVYSFLLIMAIHSLFCAGDIGLLSVFYRHRNEVIYTFDVQKEKKSYYYQKRKMA
ncbi:DUF3267 domain-containing protein [Maribellus sp. YY47]|uniref:DUF3267 domain-containing protein n=1 Tax=Maribellus sp. YY47 TaxID=2929486 RepID=UPI0020012D85|nr:DUF3267 domain-containing protein [Maribellus sp. YY47]MCK3684008.1 DUF3267 domain-containing protein [Maribellus sp. YY47]